MTSKIERSIVTGTGRSGTTVFIQILADLGFTVIKGAYNNKAKGGLEYILNKDSNIMNVVKSPPIFKDPRLLFSLHEVLEKFKNLKINRAFLCMREYEYSAKSGIDKGLVWKESYNLNDPTLLDHQINFHQKNVGKFIETISVNEIPLTILHFPRFIDPNYLYDKLKDTEFECDLSKINTTINRVVRKEYINEWKKNEEP